MNIEDINSLAKKIRQEIEDNGISSVRNLFVGGDKLAQKISYNPTTEYIKRMLISQMDLDRMLMTHRYSDKGFEARPQFVKESKRIRQYVQSNSILQFDNSTINALFGNSLKITSKEEHAEWEKVIYEDRENGKSIDEIFFEEEFKLDYENERNPLKKFIKSFKYRKTFSKEELEDIYTKKIRKMIREGIANNPEDTFNSYHNTRKKINKGIEEYDELQTLEEISKMTLSSLMQSEGKPINIEDVCCMIRREKEYRKKQVTLGKDIQTIPYDEIPKAIEKLQQEYEELYTKEEGEQYIKGIAKIYADFIYIQPYEEGNKRTAMCLLNSMFLSKGIIPPPISLINDEQMVQAFSKAGNKDYKMLQDLIIDKYNNTQVIPEADAKQETLSIDEEVIL